MKTRSERKNLRNPLAAFSVAAAVAMMLSMPAIAAQPDYKSVKGPTACAECHKVESKIWEATHHFKTYTELPRTDKAREIADKMGFKRIKAGSLCLDCHFTSAEVDGERTPIAGISCESCHGAAKGFVDIHSKYSGKKNPADETPAEAAKRWKDSEAAGMIRPANLYALAKNCYSCHVVPQEALVNTGGHAAGSDFELVSWSQGEIRHNTWYSKNSPNKKATPERRRMMYIVGTAVELETALRATAVATEKATYGVSMARRADAARKRIKAVAGAVDAAEIKEISAVAEGVQLKLNNKAELEAAAEKISAATKRFVAGYDGSKFAGVDAMIPGADKVKGEPAAVEGSGGPGN